MTFAVFEASGIFISPIVAKYLSIKIGVVTASTVIAIVTYL